MDPKYKSQPHPFFGHLPLSTSGPLSTSLSGVALLRNPYFNKGSAFSQRERDVFELHGLLPQNVGSLQEQVDRAYRQFRSKGDDLAKNTFMNSLRVQNEVLFYRLILDHLKEMFPIIYTPTEGDAIAQYSELWRRPEGCFLNVEDQDRVAHDVARWGGADDIDLVVVSDGEQILGIGDQGVGGILISVAKLMLYTLCAGINPARTLPVVLDCGTNNEDLLKDELYLGLRKKRVRGETYDKFVDTFVRSVREAYPKAYIHFEDFGLTNARRILDRYTPSVACFNDDVQGTGCVTLAALLSALHVTGDSIGDIRIVMYGAGTAGTGIADQIRDAIAVESGKSKEDAGKHIWAVDRAGVLVASKHDKLTEAQKPYAQRDEDYAGDAGSDDLLAVIKAVKPHVLIGTSTHAGAFTEAVVREMAAHVARPIIFPLSNPTRLHEAVPADLIAWTDGKALVATGSPFDPVEHEGKTIDVAECNNSVCFPGIGLGAILSRTSLLSPPLLVAATKAIAAASPALKDPTAALLPDVDEVREISVSIAAAVIRKAVEEGLVKDEEHKKEIPEEEGILKDWIREQMWEPEYRELKRIDKEEASREARGEAGPGRSR